MADMRRADETRGRLSYDYLRSTSKHICWWIRDATPFALALDVWIVRNR